MKPHYQEALLGTLRGNTDGTSNYTIENKSSIAVIMTWVFRNYWTGAVKINPGQCFKYRSGAVGGFIVFKSAATGGFLGLIHLKGGANQINNSLISQPNDIGVFPLPNRDILIPRNSPNVIVGLGSLPGGNKIIREQYWLRMHDSYSLAPQEERTINYTATTGMQESSSSIDTVSKALSTSVSGGWGPISASVSGSLSENSTRMHHLSFHTQTTRFTSDTIKNTKEVAQVYIRWQLIDIINIIDNNGNVIASIVSREHPSIVATPYDPNSLTETADYSEVSEIESDEIPELIETHG